MSDIAHPQPIRLRLRSSRLMLIIGLVLVVAATIVVVALSSGSSESSSSTVTPATQTDGARAGTSVTYPVSIKNLGFNSDSFALSSSGGTYAVSLLFLESV